MLHQINDNLFCVNLTDITLKQTKTIAINHIVIVDNINILNNTNLNEIINIYPQMLTHYNNFVIIDKIHLIITYPKLKCVQITANTIYSEFRKIIYNKNPCNSQIHEDMLEECINHINPAIINEIVVFTYFNKLSEETIHILNKLNEHKLSIITPTNISAVNLSFYHVPNEYTEFINSKVFCHYYNTNIFETKTITIQTGTIFGTDINTITCPTPYNFILINEKNDIVIINDTIHNLTPTNISISDSDCLEMLECILFWSTNINNNISKLKNALLLSTSLDIEVQSKKIALHNQYKKIYNEFINDTIQNIDIDNSDENIKVIMEYGQQISLSSNKNFTLPSFGTIDNTEFIKYHEVNNNKQFLDSLDIFESTITLSNWYDEVKNNCALGFLFTFYSSNLTKLGVHCFSQISNITTMFMSITDYITSASEYFTEKSLTFGDLNNLPIITDSFIGTANALLPIYIHKEHWKIAKMYMQPLLGLILGHSPFSYIKSYENIYYYVFTNMTNMLFDDKLKYINDKFIYAYFGLFRTCAEICFENKYNFGIKNFMNMYLNNPQNRISKSHLDYQKMFTQILTTGYNVNITTFLLYLLEETIRKCTKRVGYTNEYFFTLKNLDNDKLKKEFNKLIKYICIEISVEIQNFVSFYKMNKIFREMIKQTTSYNQFIKKLDQNYNVLSLELINFVHQSVTPNNNHMTFKDFYNIIGLEYDQNKVIMYILQGICCRKNNVVLARINDGTHIDIINTDITDEYILNYIS